VPASSGQIRCQSVGRRCQRRTFKAAACSSRAQYAGGTLPRARHMAGALADTPMAHASALNPPAISAARSTAPRTPMDGSSVITVVSVRQHTNVMQETNAIEVVSTLAERLREARGALSQAQVAKRAGVSIGTIGNLESGTRKQPRKLLDIANALGVSPRWLETGRGPRCECGLSHAGAPTAQEQAARYHASAEDTLRALGSLLASLAPSMRAPFADVLHGWALGGSSEERIPALLALLQVASKPRTTPPKD